MAIAGKLIAEVIIALVIAATNNEHPVTLYIDDCNQSI
jgi:hypothetical protein